MTESLSTVRLRLATPTPADAAAILAIAGDPRAVQHNPPTWLRTWMRRRNWSDDKYGTGWTGVLDTGAFAKWADQKSWVIADSERLPQKGLRRHHGMDDEGEDEDGQDLAYMNRPVPPWSRGPR